jgi:predicted transcriptional regulator
MASGPAPLEFVLSSSVRSDVLLAVADGQQSTNSLLEGLDASSSAVYNALGRLEEAGLLVSDDEAWSLTGSGHVVADFVVDRGKLSSLLDATGDYFATHDAGALPERYRRRMGELADGTVISASETEPQSVVREVGRRLERADTAFVISSIYDELFESALPETESVQLVLDSDVVDSAAAEFGDHEAIEAELSTYETNTIRVTDVDFAASVTDGELLLSLPLLDGGYDARTEFIAEHAQARTWGQDLFDDLWAEATTLGDYVRETHL